jgi:parallel beta-helix repeat protein
MQGFTIRNYSGSGVTTGKTHHVLLRDLLTDHAGRYGLAPVESEDIVIDSCLAAGFSDAGIAVSASRRVTVQGNLLYGNVAGIKIENTVDALVQGNEAFDNTAGLLAYVLPHRPSPLGQNCVVRGNSFHDNNRKNGADPTASIAKLPAGVGVLVMAADGTVVQSNQLTGNRSVGVAMLGLAQLLGDPTGLDVDPEPDGTILRNNNYFGNGKDPDPALKAAGFPLGGDILWDSKGKGNCLDEPQGDTLAKVGNAGALPVCL